MSTNASIGMVNDDGSVSAVYLHWDGSLNSAGSTLSRYYTDPAKVKELISLGAISVLDQNIGEQIDFNDSKTRAQNKQCLFYHRDRGEDWQQTKPGQWNNVEQYISGSSVQFTYLFANGRWSAYSNGKELMMPGQEKGQQSFDFD